MSALTEAIDLACRYLAAMERRDFDAARACVDPGPLSLTFPGGRRFTAIEQIAANSAGRYARVQKTITGRHAWADQDGIHVLIQGTLFGAWRDGTPFEGIRFIDRFTLRAGRIVTQEVWNDAGEHQLSRQAEGKA